MSVGLLASLERGLRSQSQLQKYPYSVGLGEEQSSSQSMRTEARDWDPTQEASSGSVSSLRDLGHV